MYFSMIAFPDVDPPALHTALSVIWWNSVLRCDEGRLCAQLVAW